MQWATVRNLMAAVASGFVVWGGPASAATSACDALGNGNIVKNCGFETGNLTDWNSGFQGGAVEAWAAHSGVYSLMFDSVSGLLPLYQTLTTTANTQYTISFWAESLGTGEVTVSWGGDSLVPPLDAIPAQWTYYSYTATANTGSTVLTFNLADPAYISYLDDIIVVADPVSEPSSLAIFAAVLVGMGLTCRQRARRPAREARTTQASNSTTTAASAIRLVEWSSFGATI